VAEIESTPPRPPPTFAKADLLRIVAAATSSQKSAFANSCRRAYATRRTPRKERRGRVVSLRNASLCRATACPRRLYAVGTKKKRQNKNRRQNAGGTEARESFKKGQISPRRKTGGKAWAKM